MSYTRNRYRRPRPHVALGDAASTITNLMATVGIATDLATDPYLPETICRVGQIKALNAGKQPAACVVTPMNKTGGVGLRKFIKPLRGYVYAEQHRWVYAAAVVGVIGVPMLLGYALGKASK